MKNILFPGLLFLLLAATACQKVALSEKLSTPPAPSGFVKYVIPKGSHYAVGSTYKTLDVSALKFTVRFDSSAIYQTVDPANQWDINKLYGFSDNEALHQQFSARMGWRWSQGALRLFAYCYNNGERTEKEITTIPIGKEVLCAISVRGNEYVFTVGNATETMARQSRTARAKGYQLYPYFGGDEPAPHEIRIWIKDEQ